MKKPLDVSYHSHNTIQYYGGLAETVMPQDKSLDHRVAEEKKLTGLYK